MTFELCIPAFNEAPTILRALEMLRRVLPSDIDWVITVVENGSTDGTADVVQSAAFPSVRVLRIKERGKGLAVQRAAAQTTADFFGFIDADLSADPSIIGEMLSRLKNGADVVIGSRLLNVSTVRRSWFRTMCSQLFREIVRLCIDIRQTDTQCGLKLMNRKAARILTTCKEEGWFFDLEFLAYCQHAHLRIEEIPVAWEEFRFMQRKSKLRVLADGWGGLRALFRIRGRLAHGCASIYDA